MKTPIKAKNTPRNQLPEYHESLVPAARLAPAALPRPPLSSTQFRFGLGLIWVAAALTGGIGIGLVIRDAAAPMSATEAPAPVATAQVTVEAAASAAHRSGNIASPSTVEPAPGLAVTTAESIAQAQAGNAFTTGSTANFQPAAAADALQPGFANFGRSQGNIGIQPVR